jgi:hypothetical protein
MGGEDCPWCASESDEDPAQAGSKQLVVGIVDFHNFSMSYVPLAVIPATTVIR